MDNKTIRVRVFGRDYALRVKTADEAITRNFASYVDTRMHAFRNAHPDQPEITVAVVTALEVAEQLFSLRERTKLHEESLNQELNGLTTVLSEALSVEKS